MVRGLGACVLVMLGVSAAAAQDNPPQHGEYVNESIRGRIVWLAEAMQRRYGAQWVPAAAERVIALETTDGRLIPLVEDGRGVAFREDPRLRALADVELLVRRYPGAPMVQVVKLYCWEQGQRLELDYWCEICRIAMFQLKPCDCCQGTIELRRRPAPVDASK